MLFPKERLWETHLEGLHGFSEDFLADGRPPQEHQERELIE